MGVKAVDDEALLGQLGPFEIPADDNRPGIMHSSCDADRSVLTRFGPDVRSQVGRHVTYTVVSAVPYICTSTGRSSP